MKKKYFKIFTQIRVNKNQARPEIRGVNQNLMAKAFALLELTVQQG